MKKNIFIFLLLILLLISCKKNSSDTQDSIFDLREHDFSENPIVPLDGPWEMYWEKLYSPEDFKISPPEKTGSIRVPSNWNGWIINNTKLSGYGFATYRTVILLPEDCEERMELKIGEIDTSYKLFVNNQLIITKGIPGTSRDNSKPEWDNVVVVVDTHIKKLEIIIQVSNYDFITGGIGYKSISIGEIGSLSKKQRKRIAMETILFTLLVSLGFFNLIFFIFRRKEYAFLWMTLLCFSYAISAFTTGEREVYLLFFPNSFKVVTSFAHFPNYCGLVLILLFGSSIFPGEVPKKVLHGIVISFSIATVFVIIFPTHIYSQTMYSNIGANFLLAIYITFIFIKAIRKKRQGAGIFIIGWLFVLAVVITEVLGIFEIIRIPEILPLGVVIFLVFHTILLSIRVAHALADSEHLTENLIAVNNLKDDFLAKTSHEFRTPLHAIMGIAISMLEDKEENISPENRSNLEVIVQSSKRLAFLVNDIIDFYTIKHSTLQLRKKPVNIYAVTNTVLSLIKFLNPAGRVKILNTIPHDLDAVYADEYRIQQVLLNLIENSLKHTNAGSIIIHAIKEDSRVIITVKDTGKGIPLDKQKNIFNMFEQFDIRENRHSGSGIGLAITKQIIELHDGRVTLDSIPDKGTVISFTLPIYTGEEKTIEMVSSFAALVPGDQKGKDINGSTNETILIVDDEVSNIHVIKNYIKQLKFNCHVALTGEDALVFIKNKGQSINLVVLDVTLPGINGYEVCKEIRKKYSLYELPVLMVTARINKLDIVAGFEAGANDYITKPFDKDEFIARIKTHLKLNYVIHANADLEKAAILKQLFLSMLSHDIREPLYTLQIILDNFAGQEMFSTSLKFNSKENRLKNEKEVEAINALYSEILYLENLAERFLKLAQIENGNISCIKIIFDPFNELQEIVERNKIIGKRKKQTILYVRQTDKKVKIKADKDMFISIFNNIINNAMKFSPSGKTITIKAGIFERHHNPIQSELKHEKFGSEKRFFRVEVKDKGPGLTEDDNKGFLKGKVSQVNPTGGEPSSGIGLYIVRHLIDLHEGKIGFKNNTRTGATVIIELPVFEPGVLYDTT